MRVHFISVCLPQLIKYSQLTDVSKAVWDTSMLPGFTFPGILILLPNRCEKKSCHTLLWWPQWFCAPVQIQRFSITMQIKGCKAEGDKTCYFPSKGQRFFTTNLSVRLVYSLTDFKSNLEVVLCETISFGYQFTRISDCLEKVTAAVQCECLGLQCIIWRRKKC